jgi:putative transposase
VPIVVVLSHGPASLIGVHLRYRYRVEPAGEQRSALAKAFGCARVVYNDGLRIIREDAFKAALPFVPDNELLRIVTTEAKKTPERRWLAEVSAVVLSSRSLT